MADESRARSAKSLHCGDDAAVHTRDPSAAQARFRVLRKDSAGASARSRARRSSSAAMRALSSAIRACQFAREDRNSAPPANRPAVLRRTPVERTRPG